MTSDSMKLLCHNCNNLNCFFMTWLCYKHWNENLKLNKKKNRNCEILVKWFECLKWLIESLKCMKRWTRSQNIKWFCFSNGYGMLKRHNQQVDLQCLAKALEGMFFLDYSANMISRETVVHTRMRNNLCDLFQLDFYFYLDWYSTGTPKTVF